MSRVLSDERLTYSRMARTAYRVRGKPRLAPSYAHRRRFMVRRLSFVLALSSLRCFSPSGRHSTAPPEGYIQGPYCRKLGSLPNLPTHDNPTWGGSGTLR